MAESILQTSSVFLCEIFQFGKPIFADSFPESIYSSLTLLMLYIFIEKALCLL